MSFSIFCFVLGTRCQQTSAGVPGSLASMLSTNKVYFTCCCWNKISSAAQMFIFSTFAQKGRKHSQPAQTPLVDVMLLFCEMQSVVYARDERSFKKYLNQRTFVQNWVVRFSSNVLFLFCTFV